MTLFSSTRSLLGVCLLAATAQSALASVVTGDLPARAGEDGEGIGYSFQMYLDASAAPATETLTSSVASRAWSDPVNLSGPLGVPLGWTHNSNWVYIKLESGANVQIILAPNGSDLVPAMTLWKGADNSGGNWHTYEQDRVPFWVDDPGFSHLDHVTTGPGGFANQNATLSAFLPAGEYTVALGGNDSTTAAHLAGYTFTVSAAPVPVPAAVYLFGSALMGMTALGRRAGKSGHSASVSA